MARAPEVTLGLFGIVAGLIGSLISWFRARRTEQEVSTWIGEVGGSPPALQKLSPSESELLRAIASSTGASVALLATRLRLTPTVVRTTIAELEDAKPISVDKNGDRITLTPGGRATIAQASNERL
jgi:DNA-binding MarR family transcriptional regulator